MLYRAARQSMYLILVQNVGCRRPQQLVIRKAASTLFAKHVKTEIELKHDNSKMS